MDLGKFKKDNHSETRGENRGEGREFGGGGREIPEPTKLYQKNLKNNKSINET